MNDFDALQGLWKIQSTISRGQQVIDSATHYLVSGNSLKEIVPDLVDDGKLRTTFVLDESSSPKRLTETLDFNGPDGPPDPDPKVLRYLYRLEGDTLILCSGTYGVFPDDISEEYSIMTLVRDHGPVPESKQPSGTPSIVDELLGTLPWDDNLEWYHGNVTIGSTTINMSLNPEVGTDASAALIRAKQIVTDFERYQTMAADFAVEGLLDLKNDNWLDDDENEVSAEEFKARMELTEISVESDGDVTFWHLDGDLFWGHSIQVGIDADDNCTFTDIPG